MMLQLSVKLFFTFLLMRFQEAADEQVNGADRVVCPFAQRSDKMIHVLPQVGD